MNIELTNEVVTPEMQDENTREYWKEKAALIGVTYPNNITTDKLKTLVLEKMASNEKANASVRAPKLASKRDLATMIAADEALKLVRYQLIVRDPSLQSATGMYVTVGNDFIGITRKFIPFIETPWHAERWILDHLKTLNYTVMPTALHNQLKTNLNKPEAMKFVPKFQIIELPPLSEDELKELASLQAAQGTGQMDADETSGSTLA